MLINPINCLAIFGIVGLLLTRIVPYSYAQSPPQRLSNDAPLAKEPLEKLSYPIIEGYGGVYPINGGARHR